jgi:hypothetical protein
VMHKFSGMTLSLTFLHASLTEYVLFSGSALDTDGYLGWYTCLLPFSRCFIAFSYSIGDSPYYVYVALCIVVIVVSLIKIAASNENIECFREYFAVGYHAPDPSFF